MIERDFKGVWIPKEVYLDKKLSWIQKLIFIEIDSYTKSGKECFVSNAYLSEFLGISIRQVSENISKLKALGYIEETCFTGRKRFLKSRLNYCIPDQRETSTQSRGKPLGRLDENLQHTNISTNSNTNTSINKREERKNAPAFQKPEKEEIVQAFQEKLSDIKKSVSEAEKFYNHYESVGWRVGKNPMRNWRASLAGWVSRMGTFQKSGNPEQKNNGITEAISWETLCEKAKQQHGSKEKYEKMWEGVAERNGQKLVWRDGTWAK